MRVFAWLLATTLAALSGGAPAAPFAVQVGDSRIGLDAPPGFTDTGFTGSPRLQELAESLTSASNRILLFAISDLDLRRFTVGDTPEFRRYMLVATPRSMERDWMSRASFSRFAAEALRAMGEAALPGKGFVEHLEAAPPGRAIVLAELRRDPEVVSMLQGARLAAPAGAPPQYLLSTTTLMLVRGKALSLALHAGYESEADLDWVRSVTARWIDELQRLNGR